MQKAIHCKVIDFGTPEYSSEIELRDLVLRQPLNLEFYAEDLAQEYNSLHLVAEQNGTILATMLLTPSSDKQIKMRQVAVHPDAQGQGFGSKLVAFAEQVSKRRGYTKMILNARETAVPFYHRLQYTSLGDRFEEVGIPHYKMEKKLV
jgi:predicted GNAT family N-acyltransferase